MEVCVSVYGDSHDAFKPAFFVDIPGTNLPTMTPTTRPPTPVPTTTLMPSPLPTARLPSGAPSSTQWPTVSLPSSSPSSYPTLIPSEVPTPSPSLTSGPTSTPTAQPALTIQPTASTIMVNCSRSSNGAMDPSPYLARAHPLMAVANGSAYSLSPTIIDSSLLMSRRFGFFSSAPPLSSVTYAAYLNGKMVGSVTPDQTSLAAQPEQVSVVLKTRKVYSSTPMVQVAFQLRDADGRSQVSLSGLKVDIRLVLGVSSSKVSCSLPDSLTGIGVCAAAVPLAWFSKVAEISIGAQVDVTVSSVIVVSSEPLQPLLQVTPVYPILETAGMIMKLPKKIQLYKDKLSQSKSLQQLYDKFLMFGYSA